MYSEIEQRMLSMRNEEQIANLSRFFKTGKGQYGEGDIFLGIKVPQTRELVAQLWKTSSLEEIEYCLHSKYHEIRLAALLCLVKKYRKEKSPQCVSLYLANTEYINNWDLVDLSCYELIGAYLIDKEDRSLLYELAEKGKNIWEQRIGIVSTMAFLRNGQTKDTYAIADILLDHPHDLIRKAVGWLLREAGKRDADELRNFLRPRYKTMPRTMLRYAIEKFSEEERQQWLGKSPFTL